MNITFKKNSKECTIGFIVLASIILAACYGSMKPIPSKIDDIKISSKNNINLKTYEIPNSIFRGVMWPSKDDNNFQIWTIKGQREYFCDIPVPIDNLNFDNDITEYWDIQVLKQREKTKVYKILKKDNSKSLQIELPIKKREFRFQIFGNASNDELIIFMDLSEDIYDIGLFGYILIN